MQPHPPPEPEESEVELADEAGVPLELASRGLLNTENCSFFLELPHFGQAMRSAAPRTICS